MTGLLRLGQLSYDKHHFSVTLDSASSSWLNPNVTDLDDRVRSRLSPGPGTDPEDGVGDGHAVFSTDGVEQSHGDAEEGHAERSTASATPHTPQQADSVHGRPGDLQGTQSSPRNIIQTVIQHNQDGISNKQKFIQMLLQGSQIFQLVFILLYKCPSCCDILPPSKVQMNSDRPLLLVLEGSSLDYFTYSKRLYTVI